MKTSEPRCALLELPAELLVAILARCDFPSLFSLVRCNSQLKAVWDAHAERTTRAICIRHRLADPQSCGAAQSVENALGTALPHPGTRLEAGELQRVVKSQLCMHRTHDITSWLDFARVRHVVQRNWLAGRAKRKLLPLDWRNIDPRFWPLAMPHNQNQMWRFKLDPEPGYIVATGRIFGVHVFRASDGVRVWGNPAPLVPYAHIELSNGHFATAHGVTQHAIWRRDDLDPDFDPGSVGRRGLEYTLIGHLPTHVRCSATKMRWPYFVAVSHETEEVFRFDLSKSPPDMVTHRMTSFFANGAGGLGEASVHYVEIDARAIYLAGAKSVLLTRYDEPGNQQMLWPPDPPVPSAETDAEQENVNDVAAASTSASTREAQPSTVHYRGVRVDGFAAVHHDGCGEHLVGIAGESGSRMRLYWTSDYLKTIWSNDRALLERKTVVLTATYLPGCPVAMTQLAVENGRAVFIVQDAELGNSLWLLNLRDFADHADFAAAPPEPICLAWPVPCATDISRVEMTSDEIYVPVVSSMATSATPEIKTRLEAASEPFKNQLMYDWQWHALDGTVLVDYIARGETLDLSTEEGMEKRDSAVEAYEQLLTVENDDAWHLGGTDAFLVFSFDGQDDREDVQWS
ncbi:hypothetical protein JCM10908_004265 [Rhodotorula pacifica]|uniref:uncharacterized protein n=1 Tax=Rhodotorula pacifica TaxID=1495444 RepID=UPI00317756E0